MEPRPWPSTRLPCPPSPWQRAQEAAKTFSPSTGGTGRGGMVGGRRGAGQRVGLAPGLNHAVGEHFDLLVGQHAAGALREGGHEGSMHALGDGGADVGLPGVGQVDRVGERKGSAARSLLAVAGSAVLFIERCELENVFRTRNLGFRSGLAGKVIAARSCQTCCSQQHHQAQTCLHAGPSFWSLWCLGWVGRPELTKPRSARSVPSG